MCFNKCACDNKFIFQSHVQRAKFKISERYFTTNSIHAHELLLTLMKLRLNLNDEDLAVRFCVSTSVISNIISTLLPFLANELKSLIYWPSRSAIQNHFPSCFKKHGQVRAIIDCFEVQTQRPSQSDVNSKLYSSYKQRHTYKVLVACTPGGSVSFLSPTAGGNMSDIEIVRKSGMLDLLENGDVVLADKGFKAGQSFSFTVVNW